MIPESNPINVGPIPDIAMHDEIKCRAYELYKQGCMVRGQGSVDGMNTELARVVYAAAELSKYEKGEVGDTRAVRAARVYLQALSSFICERERV